MAVLKMYSVKDVKAGSFGNPLTIDNEVTLKRALVPLLKNEQSNHDFAKYPEDFDVYEIGTFDSENAKIEMLPQPEHCFCLKTIKENGV